MGRKLYSDEELLNRLKQFASELGRPPSQSEMNASGPHAAKTYADRFGSWNEALKTAGLETGTNEPNGRPAIPKDELLADLKSVSETVGEAPSERCYNDHGEYSVKTYCKRFGGWNSALQAAGLESKVELSLSEETLITALQEFAEELGRPPTTDEMDRDGPYTTGPYKRAFGNWNQALRRAGMEIYYPRDVSVEDLLSELQRLAQELGHVPRQDEMRDRGKWSESIYKKEFGSWNEALAAAGFEANDRWRIPREELLAELRALAEELGHPPTTSEMLGQGKFTTQPYQRIFGTWRTALQAADPDYLENYRQSDTETIPFGSNWAQIRKEIIARDNESCLRCGMSRETHREQFGRDLPVHHRIPRRRFYNDPNRTVEDANDPGNLLTLCIPCHRRLERLPVQPVIKRY
ncbi:homing endonuclease associated repeat-containing protein [Halobacterium sp. KA-6]|uniref:homing endonuclease associated repeat-containing protein n=1 Tax=Halobacterium sp. KA-6 TaxID=2896368 RepID=UPI001E53E31B|nr:hypothetical protein [Halobacterium sp. KA-6]MCD2205143.1 hypothetical protein [Halobacterium sp. KA-6]